MKFFLMGALFLCTYFVSAQSNSDLIGTWKLVSFSNDELYFNVEKDSAFLTHEMAMTYPDSTDQKKLITQAKTIYGAIQFKFESDTTLSMFIDTMFLMKMPYKIDRKMGTFEMSTPNSKGEYITDKMEFKIANNILLLSMDIEGKKCQFGLRKQ